MALVLVLFTAVLVAAGFLAFTRRAFAAGVVFLMVGLLAAAGGASSLAH